MLGMVEKSTYHLGYILGPRINAGGRVGESSFGTKLLTSSEKDEVLKIAMKLNDFNQERKNIEEKILQDIEKKIHNFIDDPVLFIDGNWHDGIIGIAASRIKEKFNKPTIIITYKDELAKASARSIAGFDIGLIICFIFLMSSRINLSFSSLDSSICSES